MLSDIDEVSGKSTCPLCGGETAYLSTDLRPVFPQERLLLELLLDAEPFSFAKKSVWCENSRYYIGGKAKSISSKTFLQADTNALSKRLEELKALNEKVEIISLFENQIERFILANKPRLNALIIEEYANTGFRILDQRNCEKPGYIEDIKYVVEDILSDRTWSW